MFCEEIIFVMYILSFHQTLFGAGRRNTVYLKEWTEIFLPICCEVADTGLAQGTRGSPAQILEGRGNVGLVNVLKPFMKELIDGLLLLVSHTFCHSLPTGCCSWWSECSTCRPGGAAMNGAEAGSWLFLSTHLLQKHPPGSNAASWLFTVHLQSGTGCPWRAGETNAVPVLFTRGRGTAQTAVCMSSGWAQLATQDHEQITSSWRLPGTSWAISCQCPMGSLNLETPTTSGAEAGCQEQIADLAGLWPPFPFRQILNVK